MSDVTTRPATRDDFDWILALITANQRDAVPEAERSSRGFIQGHFDEAGLEARLGGPGMWVAEVGGERAGAVLSSAAGAYPEGPPGRTMEVAADALPGQRIFLYGPAVVDAQFRHRGVLNALVSTLLSETAAEYDEAIAFVERSNTVSMSVHGRLGFREIGGFTVGERDYSVFARATGEAGAR